MKAGIILGLLSSPLMASTNGYDNLLMLNRFQIAEEKGVKFQYVQSDVIIDKQENIDTDCYYMQLPYTNNNEKYVYYQAALGEGWYEWTQFNKVSEKPGQYLPTNEDDILTSTYGFCFNISDIREFTQADFNEKSQLDFILSYMAGSVYISSNADLIINFFLYDWTDFKTLMVGNIINFNPMAAMYEGFPLYNTGINWVIGNPSYVIDDTMEVGKDYYTLGVTIDLTSHLISKGLFNEFNKLIYNNKTHYLTINIDMFEFFYSRYPNDEYASFTTISTRMGWGQNLENTRYTDGYNNGYNNGYNVGYQQGYDNAPKTNTESTVQSLLGALFGSLKDLLDVELLPGISVGTILGIPIVLTIITWVIHWIRG